MAKPDPFIDRYAFLDEAWTALELFHGKQTQSGQPILVIVKILTLAYIHQRGIRFSELDELRRAIDRALEASTT